MKMLSTVAYSYHLSITRGRVTDQGADFQTIPFLCITGLVFRLMRLSESVSVFAPIVDRLNVTAKIFSIGLNSLAWGLT